MQENTTEIFSINQRFLKVLDYYGLTRYKFSKETGVSEAVLLNIYKEKNKPSCDVIEILLNNYKAIDANWLLTGDGDMLKQPSTTGVISHAAAPVASYERSDKYTLQLEKENLRLIAEVERKQEMLDSFMSGDIIIKKRRVRYFFLHAKERLN